MNNKFKGLELSSEQKRYIKTRIKRQGFFFIDDFGKFEIKYIKSRKFFHNFSNKEIYSKPSFKIKFIPHPTIKQFIKKNHGTT